MPPGVPRPLAPTAHDHGAFTEPVHAFVPSIAISNLIRVDSPAFREWRGDSLVASLRAQTLFRLRVRDEHVIYVEPIRIGFRIRDLAEGADGRVVLWADGDAVITLSLAPSEPVGSVVFERCRACHDSGPGSELLAPSLRATIGRKSGW